MINMRAQPGGKEAQAIGASSGQLVRGGGASRCWQRLNNLLGNDN
jgi:hypothetical protein